MNLTFDTLREELAGRYTLERTLGAGAMGEVLLGRDIVLDRPVAVKVIRPDLAGSATIRDRFVREARTVARLRHPSIVAVHAAGEAAGHLYFVLEYVDGESLRDRLDRVGRIAPDEAASIVADVADALGYAHGQGIVHRDVKPENVLIDRSTGRAMLTDFGIAHALEASGDGRLTGTGLLVGSPRYMSPEQAAGERLLDGRSDIYSLGLVGYEMLTGTSPYGAASAASMIAKHVTEPAPPLATRAPGVPQPFAAAIDRALRKNPDERWPDARAMASALRGLSLPDASAPSARRPDRRMRWLGAGIAVGLAAIVAFLVAGGIDRGTGDPARQSFLVVPFGVIRGDQSTEWLRQGSVDMLTRNLAQWRDVDVIDYESTLDLLREARLDTAASIGLSDARELAQQADARLVVLGQLQRTGDSLTVVARVYDAETGDQRNELTVSALASADVRALFDRLANQLLGLVGAPTSRNAQVAKITTESVEAYRQYLTGVRALHNWELDDADSAFRRATEIDSSFALAYYKRAQSEGWRRLADTVARAYARLAAQYAERLPARERALVEGLLAQEEGNYDAAQRRFGALLAQDSSDAEAWYGYGDAIFHAPSTRPADLAGRHSTALRAFNRAIEHDSSFHLAYAHVIDIYRQAGLPHSPRVLDGDSIRYLESEAAARAFGRSALERARARARDLAINTALRWVDEDPTAAPAYESLADAYAAARRYPDAVATLERAMRQPSTRHADFPYRIATYELRVDPQRALQRLRSAVRQYGEDSLARRASAARIPTLVASTNVAMHTGALDVMDSVLAIATRVEPVMPGTIRAGRPTPTASMTAPLRLGARAISGLGDLRDQRVIDSAIARLEAIAGPAAEHARRQAWPLAYVGYLLTQDPKYVDLVKKWRGGATPPTLDAFVALEAGDTARARAIAVQISPPDTGRLIQPPDRVYDPLAHAHVLAAVGEKRRAIAVLEAIDPADFVLLDPDPRWAMYPRSLLERGALYEQLGERTKAAEVYEKYVALMRNGAPVLEPQVRLAQSRLAALRDAPQPLRDE